MRVLTDEHAGITAAQLERETAPSSGKNSCRGGSTGRTQQKVCAPRLFSDLMCVCLLHMVGL